MEVKMKSISSSPRFCVSSALKCSWDQILDWSTHQFLLGDGTFKGWISANACTLGPNHRHGSATSQLAYLNKWRYRNPNFFCDCPLLWLMGEQKHLTACPSWRRIKNVIRDSNYFCRALSRFKLKICFRRFFRAVKNQELAVDRKHCWHYG